MKRKTTISLTIAALLGMAGMIYAANHIFFTPVIGPFGDGPIGVAASPTDLFATQYCSGDLKTIDCLGNVTVLTTIPGIPFGQCAERYMSVAPFESVNAGFTPRDVFISQGSNIFQFRPPVGPLTPFTMLPACGLEHTGITFDHVGTFANKMIVTCENGAVWTVDGTGAFTLLASLPNAEELGGPNVAPLTFGTYAGQLLVTNDQDAIHAVRNDGFVTLNAFTFPAIPHGPEAVLVVPANPCTFSCSGGTLFQAIENGGQFGGMTGLYKYPPTDFIGLAGDIIVPSEFGEGTNRLHWNGSSYDSFFFDNIPGAQFEGANFVDCDIPSPTPTATATATFTPTPTSTATFTPTSTATFTPTSTATFTPTSTATFTPTSTATFTPTPTASFTPTPTATATATPTFTPCNALSSCTPPYPFTSGNPRTSIAFNESGVLRAFRVTTTPDGCTPVMLQMFYNDEHAMTLGVRQTQIKTCAGITVTGVYPVSPMTMHPADHVDNPMTGATEAQGGVDPSGRPMPPELFITDLDVNPNPLGGDWQYGGTGITPDQVFGTWKAAVETLDQTVTPNVITVTPDADPAVNNWNLDGVCPGPDCPDPVPTPTPANEGYGAECRWNISSLNLTPGHHYRFYFIVHDGDQNKTGGDSGQACVFLTMPGSSPTPSPTPTASPTPTPTATASPGTMLVGTKAFANKTVSVSFFNGTGVSQLLTGLSITWPQATNGNLTKITENGTTIYNTSTGGGSLTTSTFLPNTTTARTTAAGTCDTVVFTFQNNVNTNPANYTGSLTFNPFGTVTIFP